MNNQIKIESLIKRYQATDPILFDILNGFLSEFKGLPNSDASGQWGDLIELKNHQAGDFQTDGAEVWSVVGVATLIQRVFRLSLDGKMMFYSWVIEATTIVTGGIGRELRLRLPGGYRVKTRQGTAAHIYNGSGHNFLGGANLEAAIVLCQADSGTDDFVRVLRYNYAHYAASANSHYVRGSILIPVERAGD